MSAPCGGCPPHCGRCIFDQSAKTKSKIEVIVVPAQEYGCVRPDGGDVVIADGVLGMMRHDQFHPVTRQGAEFLHATGNDLSAHC